MKPLLAFVITAFALPMALPAADAQASQAAYMKSCKVCHGPQGEGNPAIAKAMNANLPNLGSKAIQAKSDADIKKTVVEGKGKMRPVKTLTAAEIDAAIAYVRTLGKN
jgi:mono/diheme cytochrome c family protein